MELKNIFIGVPQSKYAGIAIAVSLGVVALAMLFGKDEIPIGQKFLFVLLMIVIALPSILLALFQLTCVVTGAGVKNQRWWCAAYAWIGTVFIGVYSALIIIVAMSALVNGHNLIVDESEEDIIMFEEAKIDANRQAREYFQNMSSMDVVASSPTMQVAASSPTMEVVIPEVLEVPQVPVKTSIPPLVSSESIELQSIDVPVKPIEAVTNSQPAAVEPSPVLPAGVENFSAYDRF
jgi:hypothetical protein